MIGPSARARRLPVYAVGEIAERKRRLLADGVDVIDLGAGDADLAPPAIAVETLYRSAQETSNSRYAFQLGLVAFREAVGRFMERRFGVAVDPMTEVLPLIGSKEGLAHLPFAVLDPGDVCVVPEPGYPAYLGGSLLAGADVEIFPLTAESGFLVELDTLPPERLTRTKLVYLNYPNNPTAAIAPADYLRRTIAVCCKHDIVLAYDNPYSELTFDGYQAPSILEFPGAMDVAVEFHSLSKSFGMTGWRLAWATGNSEVLRALSKVKSYFDTGAFLAVQHAGAAVVDRAEELVAPVRDEFCVRRDALVNALRDVGVECEPPQATMYLWVPLPDRVASGAFARDLLEREGLAVLAGSVFGAGGEGFVRLSFIVAPDRMREAARRMARVLHTAVATGDGP
ncbi:MAG: aminotransferase class I/II-fold pyridoxal phosphate-dependent enzyme [Gemmatimonadetes bacterium]|nr:aminotransferase class I/II-fold pyridoxal phosphate-dependent enzyme [Gemmatimonadota bacterium]